MPAEGLVEDAEIVVDEIEVEAPPVDGPAPAGPPVVDAPAQPVDGGAGHVARRRAGGAPRRARRADPGPAAGDRRSTPTTASGWTGTGAWWPEQTTGAVLAALLPILDDLDRAREHGDLVGPFGTVAEQLTAALGKFGLTAFGEQGDPFDPTRHEAVAHQTSAEVTEPTCVRSCAAATSSASGCCGRRWSRSPIRNSATR